jgi:hypothetical protein|tara:strand:- start:195 stop:836 length:642 start_codon:yes stop_codon:yes gene_type:complete
MRIFSILCLFIYTSCAPQTQKNVLYSQKLSENETLAQYADEFLKKYEGTKRDEASTAYLALLQGNYLISSYDLNILQLKQDDSNNIIPHVESITNNLSKHLSNYSKTWGESITYNIQYPYAFVDFSTALSIVDSEYRRVGVFTKLEELKDSLKAKVMQLDKNNFPYTLQIYGIINQLITLCENPIGSLTTFNSTVNTLKMEISKIFSLAELEN